MEAIHHKNIKRKYAWREENSRLESLCVQKPHSHEQQIPRVVHGITLQKHEKSSQRASRSIYFSSNFIFPFCKLWTMNNTKNLGVWNKFLRKNMSTYVWDYGIKGRNTLWEPHLNLSENERVTDYMINTDNSEFIENCTGYNYWHLTRGNRTERLPLGFYGIFPLGTQRYIKKALKKFKDKMDASFPSVEYIKHTIYKWVRFTMPFTAELHNKHKECCVS